MAIVPVVDKEDRPPPLLGTIPSASLSDVHMKRAISSPLLSAIMEEAQSSPTTEPFIKRSSSSISLSMLPIQRSFSSTALHQNMIQSIKNRDPFRTYEVLEVLGAGSMGSVSKVRKRRLNIGGSARPHNVARPCFEILRSLLSDCRKGAIFRSCCDGSSPGRSFNDTTRSRAVNSARSLAEKTGSPISSTLWSGLGRRGDLLDGLGDSAHIRRDENYDIVLALKSIRLNRMEDEAFVLELKNEIDILRTLDHPNVVKPIEVFEYRQHLYFTMEALDGGDLYTRDPYTEGEAAKIVNSILSAIAYLHSNNMIHRDVKYENVMFVSKRPDADVKLIDFGLSKKYIPNDPLTEGVGTIYTMSPEVIQGSYTEKADVWSVGVVLFMLLSSQMPFHGKKRKHVMNKIMACDYQYVGTRWQNKVSMQARKLVDELLQKDPDERPTAEEALCCKWLTNTSRNDSENDNIEVMDNVQATIESFAAYSKLKKLALMVIAHRSTSEEIGFLRRAFQKYDLDKKGVISKSEFKESLCGYGYSDHELELMFQGCDIDGTGLIRYTEFLASTIEAHGAINEEKIAEAFDRLDADDSGFISPNDLREILGSDFPTTDIDAIIDEVDITRSGKVSYNEFLCLFDEHQEERRAEALRFVRYRRIRHSVLSLSSMDLASKDDHHTNTTGGSHSSPVTIDFSENDGPINF